jgi:hypothetical protein
VTFLNPAWLLLGLAAAIPVVLHLLRRRIGARVELPTARYLARAEAEHSRELRFRNLLLMLLRAGALILIALAAARPFAPIPGGARSAGSLAIVIDNSLSSAAVAAGSSMLDQLREGARGPLSRLRPDDRAWLITADASVTAGTREELLARLEALRPLAGAGNVRHALSLAHAAVQGSGLPGEIALLTDAQATQWRESTELAGARVLVYVPPGDPPPNNAVVEATPDPLRWTAGSGAVHVAFLSPDTTLYRVTIAGETILRGIAEPDARVRVPATTGLRGWFAGTAETERDELPLDDVRHFAAFAGPVPAATARPSAGEYAATAVATLVERGRLRAAPGSELTSADYAERLPALLVPPLDPIRLGAANRTLERLRIPWRFGELLRDTATVVADPALFGGVQPPAVYVRAHLASAPAEAGVIADTLAQVNGQPWMVAGTGYVLLGSALDPSHTSLPVSAAFVPWLERILAYRLTPDARGTVHAEPGDTVALPAWADAIERQPVLADRRFVADVPAVHFLTRDGTRVGAIVVNAPRSESLLERLPLDVLRERLAGASVRTFATPDAFDRALLSTRGRSELTVWFLALAGLALLGEMFVRSSRRI